MDEVILIKEVHWKSYDTIDLTWSKQAEIAKIFLMIY